MAGFYDRLVSDATDRVSVHLFTSVMGLVAEEFMTKQEGLDAINEQVTEPLSGQEIVDLTNILLNIEQKPSKEAASRYLGNQVTSGSIMVEMGQSQATEAKWRAICEIG